MEAHKNGMTSSKSIGLKPTLSWIDYQCFNLNSVTGFCIPWHPAIQSIPASALVQSALCAEISFLLCRAPIEFLSLVVFAGPAECRFSAAYTSFIPLSDCDCLSVLQAPGFDVF